MPLVISIGVQNNNITIKVTTSFSIFSLRCPIYQGDKRQQTFLTTNNVISAAKWYTVCGRQQKLHQ